MAERNKPLTIQYVNKINDPEYELAVSLPILITHSKGLYKAQYNQYTAHGETVENTINALMSLLIKTLKETNEQQTIDHLSRLFTKKTYTPNVAKWHAI